MSSLNTTLPGEVPPPPDAEGSRCHLLGTTGIIVQFLSKSPLLTYDAAIVDLSWESGLRICWTALGRDLRRDSPLIQH